MAEAGSRRGGSLGFVIGVAVAIPATVFALSNLESTTVEFLGWESEVPLWLVILLSFTAGAVVGIGVLLAVQARRRLGRRREKRVAAKRARETPAEIEAGTAEGSTPPPGSDVP